MAYQYPDHQDRLTCELIEKEYQADYWAESEKRVLQIALDVLRKRGRGDLLDLGCGVGRLFSVFAPYVTQITALEPDIQRCRQARKSASLLKFPPIEVQNGDASLLDKNRSFAFCLCSHVLQHLSEQEMESVLSAISRHTSRGSLLILTTTYTPGSKTRYLCTFTNEDGIRCEKELTPAEFEGLFPAQDVLPVAMFAEEDILSRMRKHGFSLIQREYYHYSGHQSAEQDRQKNLLACGEGARDIFYLLEKNN
jgi:SAM-dependent methyltransferase